ncbi:Putative Ubiquitin-like domain superfamily, ubiquitin-like modifier Hub1/Ubl5 [Septoria linicola]|uniref:Ubiquitin-like modifier HUB1 n=2 Tax=Mycosphaerellaceae TaxID=93133 RepID=A0A9Q9EL22_9PEZI|nr:putative Ubiquitin-like domain superfamily, ubiquitin-like modifier Hub1/Ubl5 [Septoria linicola]USW53912.1 Putative Ubiquitin-like domain superfamily, ubiquitin-like modifier Hub1/Ubl5 [Septoria linicola]
MPSDTETRERSASPARDSKPKKKMSGFKWKEKRPRDEESAPRDSERLERGYRDRSPRRENYRDDKRDGDRSDDSYRRRGNSRDRRDDRARDRSPRRRDGGGDNYRPGQDREGERRRDDDAPRDKPAKKDKSEKKEKKDKKPKAIPVSNEPMIIVTVNDRLGTKAQIPCLASDSVKAFKAMVAAHIGRQPHEIMLKRQGERPFKDVLSLEDYGVSNGVQLDLELDTGD